MPKIRGEQQLCQKKRNSIVIAIVGPAGSGKTTIAIWLSNMIGAELVDDVCSQNKRLRKKTSVPLAVVAETIEQVESCGIVPSVVLDTTVNQRAYQLCQI